MTLSTTRGNAGMEFVHHAPRNQGSDFIAIDHNDAARGCLKKATKIEVKRQAARYSADQRRVQNTRARQRVGNRVLYRQIHFEDESNERSPDDRISETRSPTARILRSLPTSLLQAAPSAKGYDAVRMRFGVDITNIAGFAELDMICFGRHLLDDQGIPSEQLLSFSPYSFLVHLPVRYEDPCVGDAVDCVAARVRGVLGGRADDAMALKLYSKALGSLQGRLQRRESWRDTNVLAATYLLGIFELFNRHDEEAWQKHRQGTFRLIELRGPSLYESELDLRLLMTHIRSWTFLMDAIYDGTSNLFEENHWQIFFYSMSERESNFEDSCWWSAVALTVRLATFFKDIDFIMRTDPERRHALESRVRKYKDSFVAVLQKHDFGGLSPCPAIGEPGFGVKIKRCHMLLYVMTAIIYRLYSTVALARKDSVAAECTAQEYMSTWIQMCDREKQNSHSVRAGMAYHHEKKSALPLALAATKGIWAESSPDSTDTLKKDSARANAKVMQCRWLAWMTEFRRRHVAGCQLGIH